MNTTTDSPAFDKLRRYSDLHGVEKRMDCRNQLGDNKQKSLLDAQVCDEEALVASQQSSNESFLSDALTHFQSV